MDANFNYNNVPKNFTHCLNAQCTRSTDCLRFKAALHADKDVQCFPTINPIYVANRGECHYFRTDTLTRFALGITHLFDNLPHAKAVRIKNILYKHFKLSMFYRIRNKQRLIRPEEQDFIRQVFIMEKIEEEPVFDKYIDKYDW